MVNIKDKLNYFEKNLSVKHLGRDIIGLQIMIIIAIVIAMLLFLWIVSYATGSNDPVQVMETAEKTTDYAKWILWIVTNLLVMLVAGKAKREADRTKTEIIDMYESKEIELAGKEQ